MTLIQALILAVVEGLTEYLPISSTGHLIITSSLMGIAEHPFTKDFTVIVQFGAILSVLVLYWQRFLTSGHLYVKLFAGFVPAAVIGLAVKDKIDAVLGSVSIVAVSMIVGGFVLLFVDKWFEKQESRIQEAGAGSIDQLTYAQAFAVGLVQCFAFIPGVSRSAASIIGGLSVRMSRKAAAEFSFLLGVPTLTAATALKLLKLFKEYRVNPDIIQPGYISMIVLGNLVAFIFGIITIKAFLGFLTRRGFLFFGIYRIVVGTILLILLATGYDLKLL